MWYFMQGGMQLGPISGEEFSQRIMSGGITAQTPIWREGMPNWLPAGSVPEWTGFFVMPPIVPDYLVWAILETLCCCVPFGIVAIIFSIQANSAKKFGRYHEAMQKAATAKKFVIWGIILGAILNLLAIAGQIGIQIAHHVTVR